MVVVVSSRACANKRIEIAEHLRYLPMGWFNDNSLGEVTSGIIAAMMFLFDWRMGLITLTGLVLFFAVNAAMQRAEQYSFSAEVQCRRAACLQGAGICAGHRRGQKF